jgi:metal-responsive CopG/Arc/MetJ family transcriptional regulator
MATEKLEKYALPKRIFCDGPKKMVSVRLPKKLVAEIDRIAKDRQWSTSDVLMTALDEFAQWERRERKGRG